MTKGEYLRQIVEAYNAGRISADVYDAAVMNADSFCDDDEEAQDE